MGRKKSSSGFFLLDAVISILVISTAFFALLSFLLNASEVVIKNEKKAGELIIYSNKVMDTLYEEKNAE